MKSLLGALMACSLIGTAAAQNVDICPFMKERYEEAKDDFKVLRKKEVEVKQPEGGNAYEWTTDVNLPGFMGMGPPDKCVVGQYLGLGGRSASYSCKWLSVPSGFGEWSDDLITIREKVLKCIDPAYTNDRKPRRDSLDVEGYGVPINVRVIGDDVSYIGITIERSYK